MSKKKSIERNKKKTNFGFAIEEKKNKVIEFAKTGSVEAMKSGLREMIAIADNNGGTTGIDEFIEEVFGIVKGYWIGRANKKNKFSLPIRQIAHTRLREIDREKSEILSLLGTTTSH